MILRVAQRTVRKCIGTSLVVGTFLLFNQNICSVYSELESVLTCSLLQELIWHKNTSTTKPVSYGRSFHIYHMTTIFSVDNVINKSGMTTAVINFFKLYLTSSSTMQHYL